MVLLRSLLVSRLRRFAFAAIAGITALSCPQPGFCQPVPKRPVVDYEHDIHAILADHCLTCHNAERRSGGLALGTYEDILAGGRTGAAVKPGSSGQSLLIRRVVGEAGPVMPLGGDPLSAREIATLRTWIDAGARATPGAAIGKPRWEPPLTLTAPPGPAPIWDGWTQPLDRFTSAYLAKQGVAKPRPVDQAEFARRAYLDIWGLLPAPGQIREFISSTDPNKRQKLVASLMDNPTRYAEHWISYWNDLLRNDEGVVYYSETAQRKSITPWLLDALQTNKPYDRMVRELLNPTSATDPDGFLIGVNWRGTTSASQTPAMQASQNAAQIFVGINFKCNSCHDSFISKWKLKDAYALAAYFSAEEKLQLYRCDVAQPNQFATAAYMYPEINRPLPSGSIPDRRATVAEIFTDPRNGRLARTFVNRIWERLMGRGIVENVDDMDGEPWSPEVLDYLAADFVKGGYDIRRLISTIIGSNTYQMEAVSRPDGPPRQYSFRGPELRRLTAEQFADAIATVTGDWQVARRPVAPSPAPPPAGQPKALGVFSGAPVDTEVNLALNTRPARPNPQPAPASAPARVPAPAPVPIQGGVYAREWKIAGNSLTRALGRPIRDQVYSTRDNLPTTMQAVELVNGETLNHWIWRGAQRMLGELPPEPASLFSRQVSGAGKPAAGAAPPPVVPFRVNVSKSDRIYLIVDDNLSTAPDRATPIWLDGVFTSADGTKTPLASLQPMIMQGLREDRSPLIPLGGEQPVSNAVRVKFPSVVAFDISHRGFTEFEGVPTFENTALAQGDSVTGRFFIFDQQPSLDRLAPPAPETPLPPEPPVKTAAEAVDRVYWHLLGRAPSLAERQVALTALRDPAHPGRPSAAGLADLLWSVMVSPEFQFIR